MALSYLRRHRRWLFGFLWLVIAAFIILYIPAFQGDNEGTPAEVLATVGGQQIKVSEFERTYRQQVGFYERMSQAQGRSLTPEMLRRMGLEEQVFQGLVEEKILALEADRLGMSVPDEAVAHELQTSPAFQVDGKFMGVDELRARLSLQGLSEAAFAEELRSRLRRDRLEAMLGAAAVVSDAEVEAEYRRRSEQVKAEYVQVEAAPFRATVAVTEDEVKTRFEQSKETYRIPEKRVLNYTLVDLAALRTRVAITDRDLASYYTEHQEEFRTEAQSCASHILVRIKSTPTDADGHTESEAQEIASRLLAEVKAGGDFAATAKRASEDKGSATSGGDLGCFPRGRMVTEFDNAVAGLEPGQISDLVRTPFGLHIIRVASKTEDTIPELTTLKPRITEIVTSTKVEQLAQEKAEAVAAALAKGKTLDVVAKEQGLETKKSEPLARTDVRPPLASPSLLKRAFELKPGEVEKEGHALPGGVAYFSLAEIQQSRLPDLQEVQDKVRGDLAEEKAFAAARERATQVRERANKDGLEAAAKAFQLVRKETPSLVSRGTALGDLGTGAALDQVAFALPVSALSEPVRTSSGYAVLRVTEKKEFDPAAFASEKASVADGLRQQKRTALFQAFLVTARDRYVIERSAAAFKRVMSPGR
jgi:peptidyl-prolyl cis-trans isomerase D